MSWENIGYKVYKEIYGDEKFERKLKEADKIRPTRLTDGVKLSLEKQKIKMIFAAAALRSGQRPTHATGIAAQGVATIVTEPQFPSCRFFTPGKSYCVCVRHSTLKSRDDAMLDFLSASIRFADSDENSPLDILMSTGRGNPLSNVKGIYDAVSANRSGNLKDYYLDSPDRLASNIDGLRRAPDSFYDQRYYSEIILGFTAWDKVERYARFRLVPADGSLETGLLSEDDQKHIWKNTTLSSEKQEKNYLKQELKERISRGAVKYKLQITLHTPQSNDPPGILNIARYWDESTHPWWNVADVTLTTLLAPDISAKMRFNPSNLPSSLYLLPTRSIYDSNCIAHIRSEVYATTQRIRTDRNPNLLPKHMAAYAVRIDAGVAATKKISISISLTGAKGKTGKLSLPPCSSKDKSIYKHTVSAMDVGEVLVIHLYNNFGDPSNKESHWFVNKISVRSSKEKKPFEFLCYRWLVTKMIAFQGKGARLKIMSLRSTGLNNVVLPKLVMVVDDNVNQSLLPFEDQSEIIRVERVLEIEDRQVNYPWGELPTGVVDLPGFLRASRHNKVPRDSQLSNTAFGEFNRGRMIGGLNLGLSYFHTFFDRWRNFDSFKKLFTGWIEDVPKISQDDVWMKDETFGYQFLNGCNPCVIKRCNQLPSNFPVKHEMVEKSLDRGKTLAEEIMDGRVYLVDCKELEGIKRNGENGDCKLCYMAEPLCLFYVKLSGDLVPIAIQLFQRPSDSNPIWTPEDAPYDWLLAKMWFRNADHQVHQVGTHLLKTHLVIEAFAVASWRQLPSIHPVFQLLFPHLRSVMAINTIGRNELIAKGGIVDKTLSIGGGGHVQLLENTYKNFKFEMLCLPQMLKDRGVDDPEKLPNYYYRDDGLLMWNAISSFIQNFLGIFYQSDNDICNDHELQSWATDIHDNGLPTREGDVDHGFPSHIRTRDELQHVLTCIMFTCTCQHAAVNFPQMEITGFIPNVPPVMRLPPPDKKNLANMRLIMDTLPDRIQAGWHIGTMNLLTKISKDEQFIGDFSQNLLSGKEVQSVIRRFKISLKKISEAIKKRNASVDVPYPYLLPERVPNSIGI